jgi:type 1 glutamine amidotransferase
LGILAAVLLLLALLPSQPIVAQPEVRVLVFSRTTGFRHDSIPDAVGAIQRLGSDNGFQVDATQDPSVFDDATLAAYQAVVFALTTGSVLDDPGRAAFERYIRSGGGFAGIHSAADTEYDWPWYGQLMGAYFASHPAIQTASVLDDSGQDEPWLRTDEWYTFRSNPRPSVQVLLRLDEASYRGGGMGDDHPIAWFHSFDGGRAWYTGMGHTRESYSEPRFLRHVLAGIRYAAGLSPAPAER